MHPPSSLLLLRTLACAAFAVMVVAPVHAQQPILYSHGDPSAEEQLGIEMINRDRADPPAAGRRLLAGPDPFIILRRLIPTDVTDWQRSAAADLATYPPRPPVGFHPLLIALARGHNRRMIERDTLFFTDLDGSTPQNRAAAAGYPHVLAGETGALGWNGPGVLHDYLVEDPDLKEATGRAANRDLILEPDRNVPSREAGVGFTEGARYGQAALTEEYGLRLDGPALLVGVAYRDRDADGFYSPGEGLAGIIVTAPQASTYYTVTSSSGGYALPLDRLPAPAYFDAATRVVFSDAATGHTLSARQQPLYANPLAGARQNTKADFVLDAAGQPVIQPFESYLVAGPKVFAPTVSVTLVRPPGPPGTTGPGAKGKFLVKRSLDPNAPDGGLSVPLTVRYAAGGSAKAGVHYRALSGEVTIPANQTTAKVAVLPLQAPSKPRTVLLILLPPGDNDAPYVLPGPDVPAAASATMTLPVALP